VSEAISLNKQQSLRVTRNFRASGPTGTFNGVYYFYAVDVKTLNVLSGYPILIDGTVADNDARKHFVGGIILQRPSLLQRGNFVYGAFGGHCDLFNYTGTVIGVDITKAKVSTMWVTEWGPQTPADTDWVKGHGGAGGIWQGGLGLASDGPRMFFVTVSYPYHQLFLLHSLRSVLG
jgi:iron transport multicopper oxidase